MTYLLTKPTIINKNKYLVIFDSCISLYLSYYYNIETKGINNKNLLREVSKE